MPELDCVNVNCAPVNVGIHSVALVWHVHILNKTSFVLACWRYRRLDGYFCEDSVCSTCFWLVQCLMVTITLRQKIEIWLADKECGGRRILKFHCICSPYFYIREGISWS